MTKSNQITFMINDYNFCCCCIQCLFLFLLNEIQTLHLVQQKPNRSSCSEHNTDVHVPLNFISNNEGTIWIGSLQLSSGWFSKKWSKSVTLTHFRSKLKCAFVFLIFVPSFSMDIKIRENNIQIFLTTAIFVIFMLMCFLLFIFKTGDIPYK